MKKLTVVLNHHLPYKIHYSGIFPLKGRTSHGQSKNDLLHAVYYYGLRTAATIKTVPQNYRFFIFTQGRIFVPCNCRIKNFPFSIKQYSFPQKIFLIKIFIFPLTIFLYAEKYFCKHEQYFSGINNISSFRLNSISSAITIFLSKINNFSSNPMNTIFLSNKIFILPRKIKLKGTVSREFLLLVFSWLLFPPAPEYPMHQDCFDFFRKFTEIFASQG